MSAAKKPKKPNPSQPKTPSPSTDDIKAKFREALQAKEHHDGPQAEGGDERGGSVHNHGPATTKRDTFRRKTG
jgi:hypothetical protein